MQGVLLIDKPSGWTSFDVVNYVRSIVARAESKKSKQVKVGHSGTLDPFATGLLILLIGKAYTKRAAEFTKLDKTYVVSMRLGATSSTGDPEGTITRVSGVVPTLAAIRATTSQFVGLITQTPPAYSAIKINGERAYKLARAGKAVIIEPRTVIIKHLEVIKYAYPEVQLLVEVSSGTYIRSLVEDIGKMLGSGAYTTTLCRTQIGDHMLDAAVAVKNLDAHIMSEHIRSL